MTDVAVVGPGKGLNEGRIDRFSNLTEEMALGNKLIQVELIP